MANRLKMAKVNTIRTLHAQGWSQRKIAEQLGIHRETVARQLAAERPKPAKAPTGSGDSKPAKAPTGSEGSRSECVAHSEAILAMLQQGLSARRIHQDLTAESGFAGSYWSVRRFVQGLTESQPLPFRRIEQPPGEEAQVDFGTCPKNVDSASRRDPGSMPLRYQRSSVPTANECRRSCSRGGETPAGIVSFSCGTNKWNVWVIV
jgi:transposase